MFLITFVVMALAVLGMSIGVITGRRELKGSCGGLNNASGECPCGRTEPCETSEDSVSAGQARNVGQTTS
ncbi:MAG: (Na+)-NQR maturation NqrM [Salinisphaeraceae bacterium]|nr:(Na+)-NQR maturation NqrM [Salinisphaeraceae bacterium]